MVDNPDSTPVLDELKDVKKKNREYIKQIKVMKEQNKTQKRSLLKV